MLRRAASLAVLLVFLPLLPAAAVAGSTGAGRGAGAFDPEGHVPMLDEADAVPLLAPHALASPGFGSTRLKYSPVNYPNRVRGVSKTTSYRTVDYMKVRNYMCNVDTSDCTSWLTNSRYNFYGWVSASHWMEDLYFHNYYTRGRHVIIDRGVTYTSTTAASAYM